MKRLLIIVVAGGWLLSAAGAAWADFRDGIEAYKKSDYPTAHREFLVLAKQGMAAAQSNLGLMYSRGHGIPRDDAEAAYWYRLAGEQGLGIAQHNLGILYKNGEGVPKDAVSALMWLNLSLDNGFAGAKASIQALEQQVSKGEVDLARHLKDVWSEKISVQEALRKDAKAD